MMLTPACSASRVPVKLTSFPRTNSSPSNSVMTPDRAFISVLLPAPFSPTMAWNSPAAMSIDTSAKATTPGKILVMLRIDMTGVEVAGESGDPGEGAITGKAILDESGAVNCGSGLRVSIAKPTCDAQRKDARCAHQSLALTVLCAR